MKPSPTLDLVATTVGCALVIGALAIIWLARLSTGRDIYVSALGAVGFPTSGWFQLALVLIAGGGSLIAFAARTLRVPARILRWWRPAVSLWVASAFFLLASQVPCTPGCPIPYGATFTWQDFTHTSSAVLAFAFACWAMLQLSFAPGQRMLARLSFACGVAVAVIAATGGIMSLVGWESALGSRLEFAATTIAIAWLVNVGLAIALPLPPQRGLRPRRRAARRPAAAGASASSPGAADATVLRPAPDAGGLSGQQ